MARKLASGSYVTEAKYKQLKKSGKLKEASKPKRLVNDTSLDDTKRYGLSPEHAFGKQPNWNMPNPKVSGILNTHLQPNIKDFGNMNMGGRTVAIMSNDGDLGGLGYQVMGKNKHAFKIAKNRAANIAGSRYSNELQHLKAGKVK